MLNLGFKTSYGKMIVGKIIGWNFLTTNSTNFHEWGAASRENFIVSFIRVHSEYSWFIFAFLRCSSFKMPEIYLTTDGTD